jgi:hypothetical protein
LAAEPLLDARLLDDFVQRPRDLKDIVIAVERAQRRHQPARAACGLSLARLGVMGE